MGFVMRLREIETKYRYHVVHAPDHIISCPASVADLFAQLYSGADVEHMAVFLLNNKNAVIGFHHVSKGTAGETLAHPRDVFKTAISEGASSIILAHNHPSENLTPSDEDKTVYTRMSECGEFLGIRVLDMVIVNTITGEYCSMREHKQEEQ